MNKEVATSPKFLERVRKLPSGCWEWVGYWSRRDGKPNTPMFYWEGKNQPITRLLKQPGPGEIVVRTCRYNRCVNPDHLTCVVPEDVGKHFQGEYGPGSFQRQKKFCPKGHPYNEENTYIHRRSDGRVWRRCKLCAKQIQHDVKTKAVRGVRVRKAV